MPNPASTNASSGSAFAITPNNNYEYDKPTRAIYVGGAGDLTVVMAVNGKTVTFTAVPGGTVLPIAVSKVRSTDTTATAIVGLF